MAAFAGPERGAASLSTSCQSDDSRLRPLTSALPAAGLPSAKNLTSHADARNNWWPEVRDKLCISICCGVQIAPAQISASRGIGIDQYTYVISELFSSLLPVRLPEYLMTIHLPSEQQTILLRVDDIGALTLPTQQSSADDSAFRDAQALEALNHTGLVRRVVLAGASYKSYVLSGAGVVAARKLRIESRR